MGAATAASAVQTACARSIQATARRQLLQFFTCCEYLLKGRGQGPACFLAVTTPELVLLTLALQIRCFDVLLIHCVPGRLQSSIETPPYVMNNQCPHLSMTTSRGSTGPSALDMPSGQGMPPPPTCGVHVQYV